MILMGMIAAEIATYDPIKRICTIKIDGLTDGSTNLPEAEILYPLGDDPAKTEVELLDGDKVWIVFHGGDTRKPIIIGFRCPETNNITGLRRWHKEKIHLIADNEVKLAAPAIFAICDNLTISATQSANITTPTLTVTGNTIFNGMATFNQGAEVAQGSFAVSNGSITVPTGSVNSATNSLDTHHHVDAESRPTGAAVT